MGKYLKKIYDENVTNNLILDTEELRIVNRHKDIPNHGASVISLVNPDTDIVRNVFVNNYKVKWDHDDVTEFTWRTGSNNGHPCVFITFTNIHDQLYDNNAIVCLETNSCTKSRSGKNQSLSVFIKGKEENSYILKDLTQNVTWIYISDIELNTEYCLYITNQANQTNHGVWYVASMYGGSNYEDWTINLNIRPAFKIGTKSYTNYKALAEYQTITYYLKDEIEI